MERYNFSNVSFTGNDRIKFKSGDVIGYQQACYEVWNNATIGYTSYRDVRLTDDVIQFNGSSVTVTGSL